ncbi:IMPACT family protein [Flavobacteriaceae bacterium F08102]|nr:IMPACT family protein [Flavobacteriaceae bacterium F08102]
MIDSYLTIAKPTLPTLYKDRGSKFYGYAYPIRNEKEVKEIVDALKEEHHKARHWCYAWKIGDVFRANDDGEPNNSAGQPIYGQLLSYNVDRVLVVVVRYFGGTKLGVGGLVTAYKNAAQQSLSAAKIVEKTIDQYFTIVFDYPAMDKVLRVLNEYEAEILQRKMELHCEFTVAIRTSLSEELKKALKSTRLAKIHCVS